MSKFTAIGEVNCGLAFVEAKNETEAMEKAASAFQFVTADNGNEYAPEEKAETRREALR